MIGIVSHGAHLPAYRISREAISAAWGNPVQPGQKIVVRFDEDAVTMAADAAWRCVQGMRTRTVDAVYFASTSAPYLERLNGSVVAAICDIPSATFVADISDSMRCGTSALFAAADRVGTAGGTAIVVAADTREAEPGSAEEALFGDAAAAVALGCEGVIAELIARASRYEDFFESVRRDRDRFVTLYEGKYSVDRGYVSSLRGVINDVLQGAKVTAAEVSKLVIPAIDKKSHISVAEKLGFAADRLQDVSWNSYGNLGCAAPLVLLSNALQSANAGDLILCAGYGNGADAFLFQVKDAIGGFQRFSAAAAQEAEGIPYKSYTLFRKAREYRHSHQDWLEITNIFYNKEEVQTIRFHGSECQQCGTRHFPMVQTCVRCEKSDSLKQVALQRTGRIFTYAIDHLAASPFPPTTMAVVDLDGGGRIYCEVVDTEPETVHIGMPVELVMRRLREGGGLYHYYWKCRPRRAA
jgi:3-hydroxy-3-methylglutaryl CoA synthase